MREEIPDQDRHGYLDPTNTDATFESWYRDHFARLTTLCSRILHDQSGAEDVAQETLLRAWARRQDLRPDDVRGWLSVVARNAALSLRRQIHESPVGSVLDVPEDSSPGDRLEGLERRALLERELMNLTPLQRDALRLRELEGLDHEEVGTRLGLASGAVRAVLFRARRTLRERLASMRDDFMGAMVGLHVSVGRFRRRLGLAGPAVDASVAAAANTSLSLLTLAIVAIFSVTSAAGSDLGDGVRTSGVDRSRPNLALSFERNRRDAFNTEGPGKTSTVASGHTYLLGPTTTTTHGTRGAYSDIAVPSPEGQEEPPLIEIEQWVWTDPGSAPPDDREPDLVDKTLCIHAPAACEIRYSSGPLES